MNKQVIMFLIILSLFLLSGCKSERQSTPEKWALDYALEEYEKDYGGYGVFGYFITQGKITSDDMEQLEKNQSAKMYLIMIVDESGRGRMYNVFIFYEQTAFDDYFGYMYIKENQIIDIDIEEALYYD